MHLWCGETSTWTVPERARRTRLWVSRLLVWQPHPTGAGCAPNTRRPLARVLITLACSVTQVAAQDNNLRSEVARPTKSRSRSTAATKRYAVGAEVSAKFGGIRQGAFWWNGKITKVHDDGCYDVLYDDGDIETHVSPQFVREPRDVCMPRPVWQSYRVTENNTKDTSEVRARRMVKYGWCGE